MEALLQLLSVLVGAVFCLRWLLTYGKVFLQQPGIPLVGFILLVLGALAIGLVKPTL